MGKSVLSAYLRSTKKALLVMPIVTFQHVACSKLTPCGVLHAVDSIPESEPKILSTTYMMPPSEGTWDRQMTLAVGSPLRQEANALSPIETEPRNQNSTKRIDSPTSVTAPWDSSSMLQEAAKRLQESNDLMHQTGSRDQLSVTSFEFNQEGKWKEVTRKVKSRASIDVHLAEKGQQGYYSSKVVVVEFYNTSTSSKEANKKYVIKYPKPPKDLTEEEAGECDILPLAGEVYAYELSKALKLDLVPETQLIVVQDEQEAPNHISFGTMKPYIEDLKQREQLGDDVALRKKQGLLPEDIAQQEYSEFLKDDTNDEAIQTLKMFLFVAGQWDQRQGNVLLRNTGSPVAVDNEHIFDPDFTVVKPESHKELRQKKTFIREGYSVHVRHLGSQDKPMVLHGSTHRTEVTMWALLDNEIFRYKTYQLSNKKKELLKERGKELAKEAATTVNFCEAASASLDRLQLAYLKSAYLEEVQRGGEIVDWEAWQRRIEDGSQLAEGTRTIIFYINNHHVYRHYPMEMSLYMTQCSRDVLGKFTHGGFQKSVCLARQNTVNKINLLCDWMERSGLEFYRGWVSGFDEQSGGYIPHNAKHYPVRFVYEVDNLGKRLAHAMTRRLDSAVGHFTQKKQRED